MREGENRIGTVSSVDAATGMVSVVYEDRDGEVTELRSEEHTSELQSQR